MRDTGGAGDMLHMIIGGAGCGKSTRLMERVQAQVAAGERVITLVPEQFLSLIHI